MTMTEAVHLPRWVGVLLLALSVVSGGSLAWYATEQQQCNEAFAQAIAQRSRWVDEDRAALHELITTVFTHERDKAQMRAYRRWYRITEENERKRAAEPLPALANCE